MKFIFILFKLNKFYCHPKKTKFSNPHPTTTNSLIILVCLQQCLPLNFQELPLGPSTESAAITNQC